MIFANERHEQILKLLKEKKKVSVAELSRALNVSEVTIRKDLEYLEQQDLDALAAQEAALAAMLRQGLQALPGLHLLGPPQAAPVASFTVDWCGAYDLGVLLGRRGIAVRCGAHCAYPLMRRLGVENCCRVSLGIYNTRQDVEALLRALAEIREVCHVRS